MGVLGWVPGLESYHSVLSMYHRTSGYISIASQLYDLEGGTGYLEKSESSCHMYIQQQANTDIAFTYISCTFSVFVSSILLLLHLFLLFSFLSVSVFHFHITFFPSSF
jgi:hypothetical protein